MALARDTNFRLACQTGNVDEVEKYLKILTLDEINRHDENGSTPLHLACGYGHVDVIQLLLNSGCVLRSIKNNENMIAEEIAKIDIDFERKSLFRRKNDLNRFVGVQQIFNEDVTTNKDQPAVEWRVVDWVYDPPFYGNSGDANLDYQLDLIRKYYLETNLRNTYNISLIKWIYSQAHGKSDATWLIKAYTAASDYYKILNQDLATIHGKIPQDNSQYPRNHIISLIGSHPSLHAFRFKGETYRGLRMAKDALQYYKPYTIVRNKSFLSTSKNRKVAEMFASSTNSIQNENYFSVICTYCSYLVRTALYQNSQMKKNFSLCLTVHS
jgi:hypothetical protein